MLMISYLISELLVLVHVDLDELDLSIVLFGQRLYGWRDHVTRPAPVSVEINKHWNIGLEDSGIEIGFVYRNYILASHVLFVHIRMIRLV